MKRGRERERERERDRETYELASVFLSLFLRSLFLARVFLRETHTQQVTYLRFFIFSWTSFLPLFIWRVQGTKRTNQEQRLLIPKTIGNRKRDCAWGCAWGINTTWENLQIETHKSGRRLFRNPLTELICAFRSAGFLRWCLFPKRNLTHNLFFYFQ